MLGAITGDIAGSIYENFNHKSKNFKLFSPFKFYTDDTVLTIATLYAIENNIEYSQAYRKFFFKHPFRGYGPRFVKWCLFPNNSSTNSYGNGCAMRISPIAFYYDSLDTIILETCKSVKTTHNTEQSIKACTVLATLIFYARNGYTKKQMMEYVKENYNMDFTLEDLRKSYKFNMTCEGSVPQAIMCFLESKDFEDAIRNAVSIGGDSDTIASMAGALAEAYYADGIPKWIIDEVYKKIPDEFINILNIFYNK